jgi:hypothetical protein
MKHDQQNGKKENKTITEIRTPEKKESDLVFSVCQNSERAALLILYADLRNGLRREPPLELDENSIVSNLKLIDKVDRHNPDHKGDIIKHNLSKALNEYERAFNDTERVDIFKHIYNAVEFAINHDKDRHGKLIDVEVNSLTNVPLNTAELWREATYYRQKHSDVKPQQLMEFSSIASRMSNELKPLRQAANTIIVKRLIAV